MFEARRETMAWELWKQVTTPVAGVRARADSRTLFAPGRASLVEDTDEEFFPKTSWTR